MFTHIVIIVFRSMVEGGEWPKNFSYTTCNDYREETQPFRKNFDLRKHLRQVRKF